MLEKFRIMEVDKSKQSEVELSCIVPCRGEEWPILAMTLQSIQEECRIITGNWECVVVFNGDEKETCNAEERFKVSNFRKFGNFRYIRSNIPSAWTSRTVGLHNSIGKFVWFGDSHLIIGHNMFIDLLKTFKDLLHHNQPIGILHSALGWLSGIHEKDLREEYRPQLREKFWGAWTKNPDQSVHTICMKGTSFMIEREFALEMHGWNEHFRVYGGGEPYINLKCWRMGKEVKVNPNTWVWHLAQKRNYTSTNDDIWYNFLMAAYVIGGEKWLENQRHNYEKYLSENHTGHVFQTYKQNLDNLVQTVKIEGKEDHNNLEKKAKYTLDDLIKMYGWS